MNPLSGRRIRSASAGEDGYILIGVLILLALFLIALAVAAPRVGKQIERDKEVEAVQRGKQFTRAIKLYYKRYGNYPSSITQLENTNNIRYLRKRYKDPITGKDDWRIIHAGEAKVPVMGFFGQPLQAGLSSVTTGPNGGGGISNNGGNNTFGSNNNSGLSGNSSGFGGNSNNGFSNGSSNTSSSGSSGSSGDGSVTAGGGSGAPAGVLPGLGNNGGGQPGGNANGGDTGNAGGTNGTSTTGSGFGSSTTGGSSTGGGFDGGGRIVGVGIPVSKKSIVVYHKQEAFNKWEFTYDPIEDRQTISAGGNISGANPIGNGNGISAPSTTSGSQNSPFSNNNNGGAPAGGTVDSSPGGIQGGGATPPTSGTPPSP